MGIPIQPTSQEIWEKKYQLKGSNDETIYETFVRVADALAINEKDPEKWAAKVYSAIRMDTIPACRVLSNAGACKHTPNTSHINYVVSETLTDSIDGIFKVVHAATKFLVAGCSIGYDFSTLVVLKLLDLKTNKEFVHGN